MKFNILCLLLFFGINLTAQKVKLKSKTAAYKAIQLPYEPMDSDIKTYVGKVNANSQDLWNIDMKKTELNHKYLKLEGYQKLEENGDVTIELTLGKFEIVKEELVESLKKLKGGDGPENKQYHYEFSYTMPIELKVIHNDKSLFSNATSSIGSKNTFNSPKFKNSTEAHKNKIQYQKQWKKAAAKKYVNEEVDERYRKFNARLGFMPITQKLKFYHPNTKKLKEYQPFEAEVLNIISTISTITADAPIENTTKQTINDLIKQWEQRATDLSTGDKSQARLKKAYICNIMEAGLAIEDFEKATWAANQLITEDLDKKAGKKRMKFIASIKEGLQKTGLTTRHQKMQTDAEEISSQSEIMPDKKIAGTAEHFEESTEEEERNQILGLHEKAKAFDMEIKLRNGLVQKGIFVIDYTEHTDVVFYNRGNYRFFTESVEQGLIRKKFDLYKIESFDYDNRHFEVITRGGLASVAKSALQVIEEREVTDKMILYTGLPMTLEDANTLDLAGNFLVEKKEDAKIVDISSLKFLNFKKSFSKYISDCPELSTKVKNGLLKRNFDDLIAIVREYSACK